METYIIISNNAFIVIICGRKAAVLKGNLAGWTILFQRLPTLRTVSREETIIMEQMYHRI